MPQVHLYIRNEDVDKWNALKNKSEFVHNALNNNIMSEDGDTLFVDKGQTRTVSSFTKPKKIIKTKADAEEAITYKKTGNWGA